MAIQQTIKLPYNWSPRGYQRAAWEHMRNGGKRASLVWHRRAGKDDICMHLAAISAMLKPATYWHMLPFAAQARIAIWEAINPHTGIRRIDEAFPFEVRKRTLEQPMKIEFINGSTWQVLGSDNYNRLVGAPPYGLVFSEWALAKPEAWSYIRPILDENGGWAFFIGTPRGKNHAYKMHQYALNDKEWFAQTLTARDTNVFSGDRLDTVLREMIAEKGEGIGKVLFEQEYMCSFESASEGAYYALEMYHCEQDGRISSDVVHNPSLPVYTAWDLGTADATAIWYFQVMAGGQINMIDYHEENNISLAEHIKQVKDKPYMYAAHYAPHDIANREFTTAKTRLDTARELGITFQIVDKMGLDDGISTVAATIPMCRFNALKCARGIEALKWYTRRKNKVLGEFVAKPVHDWASHGADAFRYAAISIDKISKAKPFAQSQVKKQRFII